MALQDAAYWSAYDASVAQEVTAGQNQGGYTTPYSNQQGGSTLGNVANIADSGNDLYQGSKLFGSSSSSPVVPAAAGGAAGAAAMPLLNTTGLTMTPAIQGVSGMGSGLSGVTYGSQGLGASAGSVATGAASQTGGALLGPIGLGLYGAFNSPEAGMSLSKKAMDAKVQAKFDANDSIAKIQSTIPAGMTQTEYNDSRRPPINPMQADMDQAYKDGGDIQTAIDEIEYYYSQGYGKDSMDGFLAANSDWYNSDGSRTDYAGTAAPSLSAQRETAADNFGAHNVRDPNSPVVGSTYRHDGTSSYGGGDVGSGIFGGGNPQAQPPQAQAPATRQGGIYGEGVARQTLNGQDLYADQTLYNSPQYRGY